MCSKCNIPQEGIKQLSFQTLPLVVCLHLKVRAVVTKPSRGDLHFFFFFSYAKVLSHIICVCLAFRALAERR